MPYESLKSRLSREFPDDQVLQAQVAAAGNLDQIVAALGRSYRARVEEAAHRAANGSATNDAHVRRAEQAVDARERVILEVLAFFDRTTAETRTIKVTRTGPRHLRVRSPLRARSERAS
jgi:hypothetical protein